MKVPTSCICIQSPGNGDNSTTNERLGLGGQNSEKLQFRVDKTQQQLSDISPERMPSTKTQPLEGGESSMRDKVLEAEEYYGGGG